jgi:hypothetical protein
VEGIELGVALTRGVAVALETGTTAVGSGDVRTLCRINDPSTTRTAIKASAIPPKISFSLRENLLCPVIVTDRS